MQCHVIGVGVWGPGMPDWPTAAAVLRGEAAWEPAEPARPGAAALPPAERRRATQATRVAVTVGAEAIAAAGVDASGVASVFTSSASNPDIIDEMCSALASGSRELSPTKFHNSVHNSPAGYFGIAVASHRPSTSLGALDCSAAAGLLEACLQSRFDDRPVALVSCDLPYPGLLGAVRHVDGTWGVALVLAQAPRAPGQPRLALSYGERRPQTALPEARLDAARLANPTARLLPLLRAIARAEDADLHLDLGPHATLSVRVQARP